MNKVWYRNPSKSEVIGHCGGDEKTNDHAEPTKKKKKKAVNLISVVGLTFLFLLLNNFSVLT